MSEAPEVALAVGTSPPRRSAERKAEPFPVGEPPYFARAGSRAPAYAGVLARHARAPVFSRETPPAPPATVTLVVPTLNEEDYVEDACRSLAAQTLRRDYPGKVEILLVDSGSTDRTRELAAPYVDRILRAPRGKLTALNVAAASATGDVILEADADGYYPPSWASLMVEPFVDASVVAVRGDFIYYDSPLLRVASLPLRRTLNTFGNFPGGVRAYRRLAFHLAGGLNTRLDQSNFWQVWPEEEYRFRRRLERFGRVANARDARCFKSARRGDPVFVRDPRVDRFRRNLREEGRFQDGVTDTIYRARKLLASLAKL